MAAQNQSWVDLIVVDPVSAYVGFVANAVGDVASLGKSAIDWTGRVALKAEDTAGKVAPSIALGAGFAFLAYAAVVIFFLYLLFEKGPRLLNAAGKFIPLAVK